MEKSDNQFSREEQRQNTSVRGLHVQPTRREEVTLIYCGNIVTQADHCRTRWPRHRMKHTSVFLPHSAAADSEAGTK